MDEGVLYQTAIFVFCPSLFKTTDVLSQRQTCDKKLPRLPMKRHPHKRASLEFASSPTFAALAAVTATRSHDATITAKPELKKRSGKLSNTDPRFIGYDMLFGESVSTRMYLQLLVVKLR